MSAIDTMAFASLHMGASGAELGPRETCRPLRRLEASLELREGGGRLAHAVLSPAGSAAAASVAPEVASLHGALLRRRLNVMSTRLLDYITHSAVQYQDSHISWTGGDASAAGVGADYDDKTLAEEVLEGSTSVLLLDKRAVGVAFSDSYVLCFRLVPYQHKAVSDGGDKDEDEDDDQGGSGPKWLQRALVSTLDELQRTFLTHLSLSVGAGIDMERAEARALAPFASIGEWSEGSAQQVCALRGIAQARGGRSGMLGIAQAYLRVLWQAWCMQYMWGVCAGAGTFLASALRLDAVPTTDASGGVLLGAAVEADVQLVAAESGAYEVIQSGVVVSRSRSAASAAGALRCRVLLAQLLRRLNKEGSGCVAEQSLGTSIVASAIGTDGGAVTINLTTSTAAGSADIAAYLLDAGQQAGVSVSADWVVQASFDDIREKVKRS